MYGNILQIDLPAKYDPFQNPRWPFCRNLQADPITHMEFTMGSEEPEQCSKIRTK